MIRIYSSIKRDILKTEKQEWDKEFKSVGMWNKNPKVALTTFSYIYKTFLCWGAAKEMKWSWACLYEGQQDAFH
jgi:hypothetical protein